MLKHIIFLIVQLYFIQNAFGIECYTTDPAIFLHRPVNVESYTHKLTNCDDFFAQMARVTQQAQARLTRSAGYDCITVIVNTEKKLVVKGCVPSGIARCKSANAILNEGDCMVCSSDGCNKGNPLKA